MFVLLLICGSSCELCCPKNQFQTTPVKSQNGNHFAKPVKNQPFYRASFRNNGKRPVNDKPLTNVVSGFFKSSRRMAMKKLFCLLLPYHG
jgi:hypothetical protein